MINLESCSALVKAHLRPTPMCLPGPQLFARISVKKSLYVFETHEVTLIILHQLTSLCPDEPKFSIATQCRRQQICDCELQLSF